MLKKCFFITLIAFFGFPALACPGSGGGSQAIAPAGDALFGDEIYGADARVYRTEAYGDYRGTDCGGDIAYNAYFATQPALDFELSYLGGLNLNLAVRAECAAVLLIYDHAYGSWTFSDVSYSDPTVRAEVTIFNPADGIYSVWVGSADGVQCEAEVTLSTS